MSRRREDVSPPSSLRLPRPIEGSHVVGQLLPSVERLVHGLLAGDRRADLLGHLGTEIRELGDVDELDPGCRAWLYARVVRVRGLDGLESRLGERGGDGQ